MDQIKIGKFIQKQRKEMNITQMKLAEKLNITDRAISKWENGRGMPDSSIMLELCKELKITVNELLSGEKINMKEYSKKAEENLIEMRKKEEQQNKKLMFYEYVIGFLSSISFLILVFVASYFINNKIISITMIIISFIILLIGVSIALKIETEAGYYKCNNCGHKYVPKYRSVYFAMHIGTTRYLKCPKCNKRSWNRKSL